MIFASPPEKKFTVTYQMIEGYSLGLLQIRSFTALGFSGVFYK